MKSVYIFLIAMMSTAVAQAGVEHHDSHDRHHHGSFEIPGAVAISLGNHYQDFDLIHTRRIHRGGGLAFNLLLQHGSGFVEVSMGNGGHYYGETHYDSYPLGNHYCDESCGFQYQHYEDGNFARYDPYYGCDYHVGLIVNRYPRYVYRPYFGYGSLYYHPGFRWYKRYRHYNYGGGYYVHRRPYKHYSHNYRRYGYGNKHYGYGNKRYGYGNKHYGHSNKRYSQRRYGNKHRGSGSYHNQGRNHRGSGKYQHRGGDHRGSGTYQRRSGDHRGSGNYRQDGRQNDQRRSGDRYRKGDRGGRNDQGSRRGNREELNRKRGSEKFERPHRSSSSRERRRS